MHYKEIKFTVTKDLITISMNSLTWAELLNASVNLFAWVLRPALFLPAGFWTLPAPRTWNLSCSCRMRHPWWWHVSCRCQWRHRSRLWSGPCPITTWTADDAVTSVLLLSSFFRLFPTRDFLHYCHFFETLLQQQFSMIAIKNSGTIQMSSNLRLPHC